MAKLFYSMEEAAQKLGKSPAEVKHLAETGQLQEFRDRDKLMFKVDQVNLLAGNDDSGYIPLVEDNDDSGRIPLVFEKEASLLDLFAENDSSLLDTQPRDREELLDTQSSDGVGLLDLIRDHPDTPLVKQNIDNILKHEETKDLYQSKKTGRLLEAVSGRFDQFNAKERELLRRALCVVRAARNGPVGDIDALIGEIDDGTPPPVGFWKRLFG